jgi:hypothetical protein
MGTTAAFPATHDIRIDEQGFVWSGKFRLPMRYDGERDVLIFFDKDRRRSKERGSAHVEVGLGQLAAGLSGAGKD